MSDVETVVLVIGAGPLGLSLATELGSRAALTLVRPDQHVAWRGERWEPGVLRHAADFEAALA